MKKTFIILNLVGLLILSLGMSAMANGIYLDKMVGSSWKGKFLDGKPSDGDLNGLIFGYDYSGDKFMLNFEFSKGNESKDTDNFSSKDDFDTIHFKGGYNLLGNDKCSIAATLGYENCNLGKGDNKWNFNGIMLGANTVYNFNKKNSIKASMEYSLSGQLKQNGAKVDATILLFDTKYSYLFTDGFGASVGYRYIQYKVGSGDNGLKDTHSGPTVGVTYKF